MYPEEDYWRDENDTCSYCGSYNPNLLMQAIHNDTVEIGPTDKNYKIYLKFTTSHERKFYFQHFSMKQQQEFVDLMNTKKIKIGHPGHFYVLPYFAFKEGG